MIKYIMRKIVLSLFALCCFSAVMAQQKTRNLSVELLGAQNVVGINYDSRFNGNSGLGYRVGIGYGYGDISGLFDQKNQWRWCSAGAKLSARKEEQQTGAGLRLELRRVSYKGDCGEC